MFRLLCLILFFVACTRLNNSHDQDVLECGPELARGQGYLTVLNSRGARLLTGFEVVNLDSGSPENLVTSRGCVIKKTENRYLIRSTGTEEAAAFHMSEYESRGEITLHDYTGQSVSVTCKDEVRKVNSTFAIQSLLQTNLQANLQDAVQLEYEFVKPTRTGTSLSLSAASSSLPLVGETAEGRYELRLLIKNQLKRGELEATCQLELDRTPPQPFASVNSRKPDETIQVHGTTRIVPVGLIDSFSLLADEKDGVTLSYCLVPLSDNFDESDQEAKSAWISKTQSKDCLGHKVLTASPGATIASEIKSGFWSVKFYATDAVGNVSRPEVQNILIINRDSHRLIADKALAGIGAKSSIRVVENALEAEVLRNNLPTRYEREMEREVVLSSLLRAYYQETVAVELNANEAYVRGIAMSANGQVLASLSFDGALKLWDIASGQSLWSANSPLKGALAVSSNGKYIAGIDSGSSVLAFDADNGSFLRMIKQYDRSLAIPHYIQFGPDNQTLLIDSGNDIEIRSLQTGEILRVLKGHTKAVKGIAMIPGRDIVVSISADRTMRYWDFVTGSNLKIVDLKANSTTAISEPNLVTISSDGKTVVVNFAVAGRAGYWDDEGTFLQWATKLPSLTRAIAVKKDGTLFTADEDVRVWSNSEIQQILREDTAPLNGMLLSPDERRLITSSDESTIRIWNLDRIQEKKILQAPHEITSLVYSQDGENLISASLAAGDVLLWPLYKSENPSILATHKSPVSALAISGDGKYLVSGSEAGDIIVQPYGGTCCATFEFTPTEAISSVSVPYDGRYFVATTTNGGVKRWERGGTPEAFDLAGPSVAGTVAAVSPDGSRVAVAGLNAQSNIEIRDSQTGRELFALFGNSGFMNGLPFSADGQRLATFGPSANSINLWDLSSRKVISKVVGDFQSTVTTLVMTGSGSRAVAGMLADKFLLIDFEREQQIKIPLYGSVINIAVAISPDGRTFATGGYDKTIRIWDFDNGPLHEGICARLRSYLDPELCRAVPQ